MQNQSLFILKKISFYLRIYISIYGNKKEKYATINIFSDKKINMDKVEKWNVVFCEEKKFHFHVPGDIYFQRINFFLY